MTPNPRGTGDQHRKEQTALVLLAAARWRQKAQEEQARFQADLLAQWDRARAGALSLTAFRAWFQTRLTQAQTRVYQAGQRARYHYRPLSDSDVRFLHGELSKQMRYFTGFLTDVESGATGMPFAIRLELYANSLKGVYLAGTGLFRQEEKTRYRWRLGEAEHCKDCLKHAARSRARNGFTWRELMEIGLPGSGKTRCKTRCKCWLQEVTP